MIFKDRETLTPRYIPASLPHREEEIDMLRGLFTGVLTHPSQVHMRIAQIVGGVGSGKTAVARLFGDQLEEEAKRLKINLKHIYANLKLHGSSRVILYRYLVQQAAPEAYSASLSAEELLYQLTKSLKEKNRFLIMTLDEIDYFIKHTGEPDVVYDITRLEEIFEPGRPCNVLGVIFTARSREFHKRLDAAALSTLGRIPIEFRPYTLQEIIDILEARVGEAFEQGVISDEVLDYVADITASSPANGDIRYALDLLLYSGNLAEHGGAERITPEHIRSVVNVTHPSITEEDITYLPDREKIVLLGVVKALKGSKKPYISLKDVRQSCGIVCEERGLKPLGVDEIEDHVEDLYDRSIVDIKSLSSIGISGVPTETLGRFVEGLIERLGSDIGGGKEKTS